MAFSFDNASQSNTMQSIGNQIGYKVRNIAHHGQPVIEINLDDRHGTHGGYVTSYSTMDSIEGTVSITVAHDTKFEDIDIAFTGTSYTFVDRLTTTPTVSGRTEATHRFLALRQPIEDMDLPSPRVFVAGKRYIFPFYFIVPPHLLPRACTHRVDADHVRDTHLMLPPSVGDPEMAGHSGVLLDDVAPEMSKVIYGVKVRVMQRRDPDEPITPLAEKLRKVRIKPAFEEQPPLNLDQSNPDYRTRQEKTIRKGLFKGKSGTLTTQAGQPKALVIPGARTSGNETLTTVAKVRIRFDPADETNAPPKLNSLATKLKVSTFFATAPRHSFPSKSTLGFDHTQGVYQESVNLSSLCVASAPWTRRSAEENPTSENSLLRRDSGISDCGAENDWASATKLPTASKNYKGGDFYTAEILAPITLPYHKNFLPTFHSCTISRTYTLFLQLSAKAPGISDPSLSLKVPVQICAEGSDTGLANARARSVAIAMQAGATLLAPQSSVPQNLEGESDELPPQYAAFASHVGRYNARVTAVG
ncbi:arrestin [Massariosphaeria phaeospora]|uniref:Arrestin n=1 Tax=Massariosphaeria phaeospora TaxID=100035 RepID=A0A7C8IB40_9PLEO|nr:arrestin [Massariosphaeria phaeospora]